MPEYAVIYLPEPDAARWLNACMEYVERQGYRLVAVVHDGWESVSAILDRGDATVVVTAKREHPPTDRPRRIEFVEDEGPAPTPRQRRPRLTRRDEAAGRE